MTTTPQTAAELHARIKQCQARIDHASNLTARAAELAEEAAEISERELAEIKVLEEALNGGAASE
ncbi:MAG: hypothetical protein ABI885_22745 [Gammaproteobacteria bacterium]